MAKSVSKNAQRRKQSLRRKRIYLDYAATTPLAPETVAAMAPYASLIFGNPSSITSEGVRAAAAVRDARETIARIVGVHADEILFTSGGTEGNNVSLRGFCNPVLEGHLVTTRIEHPSVLEVCRDFEKRGGAVSWITPRSNGIIDPRAVARSLRSETKLVSVMYANNEIGTIQPIAEIAKRVRGFRKTNPVLFHVDCCQAVGLLPLTLCTLGADLATFSAQKFYGPKGVGFIYVRRGVTIEPLFLGGGHEEGRRAGTENVASIVGMAHALLRAEEARERTVGRLTEMRDHLIDRVLTMFPFSSLNGDPRARLANNANFSFEGIEGERTVLELDARGVAVSAGSACGAREQTPSYVITSLGLTPDRAHSAVRFTFGTSTTERELRYVLGILGDIFKRARRFSL